MHLVLNKIITKDDIENIINPINIFHDIVVSSKDVNMFPIIEGNSNLALSMLSLL